ncbi:MAG: DNA-processing protein DprA [Pseudomonadota bacterium]
MSLRRKLNETERLDWLQLIRTPTIGPITFHRLLAKYGTAAEALKALPELARKAGRRAALKAADRGDSERELIEADRQGARLIAFCEEDYPAPLTAVPDPPPVIFLRGHASLFEKPAVAVIGARNASGVGRKIARTLAADLGAADIVITSGLARGIDGAAHEAALKTGTIAVVAGGVDIIYPPEHDDLTMRIANEGAIISECAMGRKPTARDFPKRNRLISGLSRGVIVVEAAAKSGTLITARFALEQGREVFAVPGSPLDPRCQGANRLIRDGATLVEKAEDVLEVLAAQRSGVAEDKRDLFDWADTDGDGEPDPATVASIRRQVREILGFTPLHRDEILRELDAPPGLVADALLELVLTGEVTEHEGGRFTLAPPEQGLFVRN